MARLEIIGAGVALGGRTILHPTDLAIADGEFVVVIGASGCGKSTLLRLIAGLEAADAGRILIDGRDVTHVEPARRGVAMVFQSYALYPHLTVAGNIGFPLAVQKRPKAEIAERVAAVAEMLALAPLLDRRPQQLSGGQRQRVAIGRAIVRGSGLLLLDEPLSNLDSDLRVRMRHELARLHQRLGATMVYVTHDQLEAMTLANRIVVMAAGRIEQVGAPQALYAHPASVTVARAIGSPAINLIGVTIAETRADGAIVRLRDGTHVRVDVQADTGMIGRSATLGVRPEHLRRDPQGPFGGVVELFERLGPLSFAHLGEAGAAETLVAQLPGDTPVTLGDTVRFSAAPDAMHLFDGEGRALPRTGIV